MVSLQLPSSCQATRADCAVVLQFAGTGTLFSAAKRLTNDGKVRQGRKKIHCLLHIELIRIGVMLPSRRVMASTTGTR